MQIWDLVRRLRVRVASGMTMVSRGWDMTEALGLGGALGIPAIIIAEMLPEIEPVAMAALSKGLGEND